MDDLLYTQREVKKYKNVKVPGKKKKQEQAYWQTQKNYYHKDHLGSIIAITNQNGKIVEQYAYSVFWVPYSKDKQGKITRLKKSKVWNTRFYTGREYERGLKLYYNRARYYNPSLWRFISRDPIDVADDVNLYAYVGNNSVMYTDPTGRAKRLQADINNRNNFQVEIVARKLEIPYVWDWWVHSFLLITSTDRYGNINKYSMGWHRTDGLIWELDWRFNEPADINWNGEIKAKLNIRIPKGMKGYELAQNLLNEYNEYEKVEKKYFLLWATTPRSSYWNCHNYTTTLLSKACWWQQQYINDFDPSGLNPWMWTSFKEKKKKASLNTQFWNNYNELEYRLINNAF